EVLVGASVRIQEEAARPLETAAAVERSIRRCDDHLRQLAACDRLVDVRHDAQERAFVERERMQINDDRILLAWIVAWRQVDVEVAPLVQRTRPDAMILAMVASLVDELALEAPAQSDDVELVFALVGPIFAVLAVRGGADAGEEDGNQRDS